MRRERLPTRRDLPHLALVGVLLLGICMAIIAWAERRVDSGLAATLAASVPLFLGLLEPGSLDRRGWCGLALGFAGVLVLLPPGSDRSMLMGMAALLGSSFLWAFGTLYGKRHGGQGGHFSQVGLEMLVAGLLSLALAPPGRRHPPRTGDAGEPGRPGLPGAVRLDPGLYRLHPPGQGLACSPGRHLRLLETRWWAWRWAAGCAASPCIRAPCRAWG